MKQCIILFAVVGASVLPGLAVPQSYSLSIPGAPVIRMSSDAADNEWLASNNIASVSASFGGAVTNVSVSSSVTPGLPSYSLMAAEIGFSVERIKPEVWLGDAIAPPGYIAVDWEATYAAFGTNALAQSQFIFDNVNRKVYVQAGGNITFTWIAADGAATECTYTASGSAFGRPYKMFWTESPWNAPTIDLSGKFVKLFGPAELITPEYGERETDKGGYKVVESNVVVRGVYLDSSANTLSAYGRVSGQFILAYYDSGSFNELKHLQVIEVGEPDVNDMKGYIGTAIKPHGSGYSTDGLWPSPVTDSSSSSSTQTDEYGDYYYQHKGQYSYSPKHNAIFPLRDTSDAPWRIDVYWMESDPFGVSWPFERSQYACSWNTNAIPVLVAGESVRFADDYTVELVKYQVPNGHARAPENKVFRTSAEGFPSENEVGFSCLKLSGSDNVWFLPVRTVSRGNKEFFTLEEEEWPIGMELTPRGGSVSGATEKYRPVVDPSVPGVLSMENSGSHYNPQLYYDWREETRKEPSVIYAVNTSRDNPSLEVRWSTSVQETDMPAKISIPTLVQRYKIVCPAVSENPQIVIASQQGGAGESVFEKGNALYFDSAASSGSLPSGACFRKNEGTVSFWANAREFAGEGRILTLGNNEKSFRLSASSRDGAVVYTLAAQCGDTAFSVSSRQLSTSAWHRVTFSVAGTDAVVFTDGRASLTNAVAACDLSGVFDANTLGAVSGASAAKGLIVDDIVVGACAVTPEIAAGEYRRAPDPSLPNAMMCMTFENGDLIPQFGSDSRIFTEEVSERECGITGALRYSPGAPNAGNGVFQSDTAPVIYRQNDPSLPGYNPNEEHAFVDSGSGGYFAWALRCDLNREETSRPGVLVQYSQNGRPMMSYFPVVLTNEAHAALTDAATVGTILPGPHPLDYFDNPWLAENYWEDVAGQKDSPAFPDRKNQVWTRCAGKLPIRMHYPNQDGFDFPGASRTPEIGAPVPWLSCLDGFDSAKMIAGAPAVWTWTVEWPKNVESMKIGQTLTKAADGLPEVWNAKSAAVVYPDDGGKTALIWDPTAIRTAKIPAGLSSAATPADLLKTFGFDPAEGNVTLRGGKYTFKDLPPAIGERFFVNAHLATADCVCLKGELESNAGGDILYPNVLNGDEVLSLKELVPADHAKKSVWDELIDTLPLKPVEPTKLSIAGGKAKVDYIARDHYALTAMGATNYVVLIENDATNSVMKVNDSDAISMHVFKVVPEYYAGRVVTREDPLNLLSQQLGILYTEAFAGKADDYEFEWKKATPTANGSMSDDYDTFYKDVFDNSEWKGLTRFTIGQQGDTLANLVNTYYVMRYRARKDTEPYKVMKGTWSGWCGPALAEGWIQRCVNNVTPFTQRMTDLYENEAETTASMIAQAGKPWTGDVALNQDNLSEVGLIELYQTLLNKAESMSLTLGINDHDANNQLLLAAERLCALYVLLGNEAYADALNPTIGFGTEWTSAAAGVPQVDYGVESTGLFCFDNQVPTLLDEELALLRGRTGENNPSVASAPFYNRLVWNFTRGITAGEVAYAVNYNINSTDKDADIDENDAARQYPQGHGDAWGHYLSALNVWYRLLRNPYFSWSASQMQMNVADHVVDVDYYDEERFAETAAKLAKTAADVVDRTARKSWRDNGGQAGAGYLDGDEERNFGYGEWATRGGIGGVMNWMVANSLLPEAESAGTYHLATFNADTRLWLTNAPVTKVDGAWTFEFRAIMLKKAGDLLEMIGGRVPKSSAEPEENNDSLGCSGRISLSVSPEDGKCSISAGTLDFNLVCMTNIVYSTVTNDVDGTVLQGSPSYATEYQEKSFYTENTAATVDLPEDSLISVSCSADGVLSLAVLAADGTQSAEIDLGYLPMDNPLLSFGGGFEGAVGEIRLWRGVRTSEELLENRSYVNPRDPSLVAYTRGISESRLVDGLPDETPGGEYEWRLFSPVWQAMEEHGEDIAFDDEGLLRINRSTALSLTEIPVQVSSIQKKLDQLDSGMNPLGLSDNAIAMDISSAGVAEGDSTHFEQIAARAGTALANAAKVLDRAQESARCLRNVGNSQLTIEEMNQVSEADYTRRLIEIYGTPYEDDIGPSGTYPQGYEGPDYYHYMYMDLSLFGVTGADNLEPAAVATFDSSKGGWTYETMKAFMEGGGNRTEKTYSYQISANGLVIKPDSIKGTRRACGKIQNAYTEYILAWIDWKNLADTFQGQSSRLKDTIANIASLRDAQEHSYDESYEKWYSTIVTKTLEIVLKYSKNSFDIGAEFADASDAYASNVSGMGLMGVGLTMVVNPLCAIYSASGALGLSAKTTFKALASANQIALDEIAIARELVDNDASWAAAQASWSSAQKSAFDEARSAILALGGTAQDLNAAWGRMVAAAENFDTVMAEGDRIRQEREAERARRVNRVIKLRYNDMFFRQTQDESLTRYSQAFDLAQKYVYMAAQTYDYETGLLSADRNSGDAFRAETIGARALGTFAADGSPLVGSGRGDPGLSDILARMKANYAVLKGRLGINNPERNATWFSLRKELFRIAGDASGDDDWKTELSKYIVDDIRSVPEYRRYCQPIASSSALALKEPALVIPFSSTIDFAKNFFGNDLAAGDHALDSSYFATKIASAGVKFEGYPSAALSATPAVYLVPAGQDRMRIPGGGEDGTILDWNVVDQVIPVPYAIGSTHLDDPDWQPLSSLYSGDVDVMAKIRRIPSFRAMTGGEDDADRANTRLIGRSAWNTRWVLIIPAGSLLGGTEEDRMKALSIFINGQDSDRNGTVDRPGVSDIRLGLRTYANSGN